MVCEICGNHTCFCKYQKYIARISYLFAGKTSNEVNKKLKQFLGKRENRKGCWTEASYNTKALKNEYDLAVKKQIIDLFAKLKLDYSYTDKQIKDFIAWIVEDVAEKIDEIHYWESVDEARDVEKYKKYDKN